MDFENRHWMLFTQKVVGLGDDVEGEDEEESDE